MGNHIVAKWSDLGPSRTNPSGIWSPRFIALKQALDRADTTDNVLQALYDWLSTRDIKPSAVDNIFKLPTASAAYDALLGLIGAGFKPEHPMPELARQTLQRAVAKIASNYVQREEAGLKTAQNKLNLMKAEYGVESAPDLVERMLD